MPEMTDARELFLHELGDMLYAENKLVKALPKMAKEATDGELRAGFTEHLEQTRGQVDRIERSFASLGEKASAEQCPGIEQDPLWTGIDWGTHGVGQIDDRRGSC